MVEYGQMMAGYVVDLDSIFGSLADPTRRDILRRLVGSRLSISEIAEPYDMTFAAISKHLKVLEDAKLVIKRRRGRERIVELAPRALTAAGEYLEFYQKLWKRRFDVIDELVKEG